jgi:predicted nucleic acid-binding protein
MSGRHHLDANVILRFLLADDPGQSPKARTLFELAQAGRLTLFISHVTLAEVSWVLLSYYGFERSKRAQALRELDCMMGSRSMNPTCCSMPLTGLER